MKTGVGIHSIVLSDEVWIVTALLHRDNPDRNDFTISEIVRRAHEAEVVGRVRPGFRPHVTLHCVANLPPNPGKTRVLYATGKHTRRLFRLGDDYHPEREGAKTKPEPEKIPEEYQDLLNWYSAVYSGPSSQTEVPDPMMALFGSGRQLWADEHPNDYVRRLREGWE